MSSIITALIVQRGYYHVFYFLCIWYIFTLIRIWCHLLISNRVSLKIWKRARDHVPFRNRQDIEFNNIMYIFDQEHRDSNEYYRIKQSNNDIPSNDSWSRLNFCVAGGLNLVSPSLIGISIDIKCSERRIIVKEQ